MAQLELTPGTGGFYWQITDLQSNFTSDNYIEVGIANTPVQWGSSSISGVEAYKKARSSGSTSSGGEWKPYGSGTFTFYGYAQDKANRLYYPAGSATVTVPTQPVTPDVDYWDWDANSSRRAAYDAITGQGLLSEFHYTVWNDMCDKCMEILDAIGDSWDDYYCSFSNTKMSSSNKEMTAKRFNSLRYNIGIHYSTGLTDTQHIYTGATIYGWYFTRLTDCMDNWIDQDL